MGFSEWYANLFSNRMTERQVERWLRASKRGKWHFVLVTSLKFAIGVFVLQNVVDLLFGREFDPFGSRNVFLLIFSPIMGLIGWWNSDSKYKNHLLDLQIEKGLSRK